MTNDPRYDPTWTHPTAQPPGSQGPAGGQHSGPHYPVAGQPSGPHYPHVGQPSGPNLPVSGQPPGQWQATGDWPGSWQQSGGYAVPGGPGGGGPGRTIAIVAAIVVGTIVLAGAVVATVLFTRGSGTTAASSSAASTSETPLLRVVPSTVLPSGDEISRITLQTMKAVAGMNTRAAAEASATPDTCKVSVTPMAQSGWGTAQSVAWQPFTNGTFTSFSSSATVGAAVYPTVDAAKQALAAIASTVVGCPTFNQTDENGSGRWTATVEVNDATRLNWTNTSADAKTLWRCTKSMRIDRNVLALGTNCSRNPGTISADLADLVVQKVDSAR
ncbi:sensor domain-containing protein [Tsukamurella sp. 8F]|uniref:sensor domain-containing protein n=1 Tax=unclassified Tsukamurella TaxID=2633480 RepID=UPI0023B9AA48|nr:MULTISPECIES: sensor domain-containing protein [unclassified Tsukamurella]MDF0530333.1 sensor domain-containing protein [Tsukamurella sp. 8J]MDF0587630.1 sensor domain-containing protein [Tsukamurella sp. 8F]